MLGSTKGTGGDPYNTLLISCLCGGPQAKLFVASLSYGIGSGGYSISSNRSYEDLS